MQPMSQQRVALFNLELGVVLHYVNNRCKCGAHLEVRYNTENVGELCDLRSVRRAVREYVSVSILADV